VRCNLNSLIAIHTGTQQTDELFDCVYNNFIEEVDAVDNGINDRDGAARYSVGAGIIFGSWGEHESSHWLGLVHCGTHTLDGIIQRK